MSDPTTDPWAAYPDAPAGRQPPPAAPADPADPWAAFRDMPLQEQDAPTRLLSYGRKAAGDMAQGIKDLWTGDDRREFDIPELPPLLVGKEGSGGLTADKMALGRDDLRKLDIFRKMSGENVPAMLDRFGNVVVALDQPTAQRLSAQGLKIGPGRYYLNRPGASSQDLADAMPTIALTGGGAAGGAAMGARMVGGNILGRMAGAGVGAAIGSAEQDLAATAAGSERGVSGPAALVAGAFGGLGEGLAAGVVTPFLRRFFGTRAYVGADGTLTQKGAAVLERAGLDPQAVTPDFVARFQQLAKSAADPEAAAAAASGQTLPVRVPLSRGDVSRDVSQQGFEDAAELGQLGTGAQRTMTGFRQQQQDALRGNVPAIQARLGGGEATVAEAGQGMERVQNALVDKAQRAKDLVNDTYAAARAGNGGLPADQVQAFAEKVSQLYPSEFSIDGLPAVKSKIDELANITKGSAEPKLRGVEQPGKPGTIAQALGNADRPAGDAVTTIRRLEQWRAGVNAAWRAAAPKSAERVALGKLLKDYDAFADDMVKQSLFQGDKGTLELWQKARGLNKEFAQNFESNVTVRRILTTDKETGRMVLAATPTEALDYLFTASGAGGKVGATRALQQLQKLLGPDSPEWSALKEEAFLRLVRNQGKGNNLDTELRPVFSGNKFATALDDAFRSSPELMRTLYSPQEIALLQQFKQVALQATNRVRGATNPSGTGGRLAQLVQQMAQAGIVGRFGTTVLNKAFGWVGQGMNEQAAKAAIRAVLEKRQPVPVGLGGAAASSQREQWFDRKRVQPGDLQ